MRRHALDLFGDVDTVGPEYRALDLFCGGGGVSEGLLQAGFDVVGVDLDPKREKPYLRGPGNPERHERPAIFVQADALTYPLDGFDFIWASPPCQAHVSMSNRWRGRGSAADAHVSLIGPVRERLQNQRSPWVIENVVGAARHLRSPLLLSGAMFALAVHRPRLFESSFFMLSYPTHGNGATNDGVVGVYGSRPDGGRLNTRADGTIQRRAESVPEAQDAMGIGWMDSWRDLCEAIPPAYAEWIGRQALGYLSATGAK